jgi:hypothetical protein
MYVSFQVTFASFFIYLMFDIPANVRIVDSSIFPFACASNSHLLSKVGASTYGLAEEHYRA